MTQLTRRSILGENRLIMCLGIAAALAVLVTSYLSPEGQLSPDSARYLELVQTALDGTFQQVTNDGRGQAAEIWS